MRSALVALLLLAALVPLPSAQAAAWSVQATVAVNSATQADYTWTITGVTNTNLELPRPDNATLVRAVDANGGSVTATNTTRDGEPWIRVEIRSRSVSVQFSLEGQRDGALTVFPAQVASATDSPVTVRIALPGGYTLAGYRDSDDRTPDLTGAFTGDGPAYVQYLVLGPGYVDEGPVAGVSGRVVKREGTAEVSTGGATWRLVTTYDTDVFSRSWDVHVPPGATVTAATSPFGPLATSLAGDVLAVTTPYPVGYHLGARSFTIEMSLPAPAPHGGTFREINLSVRAADDDDVSIVAHLAPGLAYTGARVAGGAEIAPLEYRGVGPLSVGLAFLPPAAPDHVQFTEGRFVVDAPRALEAAARATARNASALLPRAADFAFLPEDARPFYVAYTDADVFGWEEGFYSNGLNTITIRASTLADASDGAPHLVPVGVLVHEATHGLVDRRLPDAPHDLSFLHEGLARLAETRLESIFPAGEVVACESGSCLRHSARPNDDTLRAFHQAGRPFDVAWRASSVPDADRGFLYDYSGLVLHAFETRSPAGALANALAHINATTFTDEPAADAQRILDIFLANTPGTTSIAFLYPGREAASLSEAQFRACMAGLVAPPYPWEDVRAPNGGCPATGYGSAQGALPTPPSVAPTPTPIATATPVATATPAPRPVAPTSVSPVIPSTDGGTGVPDRSPGAVVDDEPSGGVPDLAEVPGATAALVLAALAAIALVRRRL